MINVKLSVISRQEVETQTAELKLDWDQKQAAKVIAIETFKELIDKRHNKGGTITADYYADIYNFNKEGPYSDSNKDDIWNNYNNDYNFFDWGNKKKRQEIALLFQEQKLQERKALQQEMEE